MSYNQSSWSCNWGWSSCSGDGSSYVYLTSRCLHFPDISNADYSSSSIRFFEDVGLFRYLSICLAHISYPSSSGFSLPPTLLISTIITFRKSRSQFMALLSSKSNVTSTWFLWLMLLASVDVPFIDLYNISLSAHVPLNPWISKSWENARLVSWRFPLWYGIVTEMGRLRWSSVLFWAFLFFGFFGFTDEGRKNYRFALQSVVKHVGISTGSFGTRLKSSDFIGTDGCVSAAFFSCWLLFCLSRLKSKSAKVRLFLPLFVHQEMSELKSDWDDMLDVNVR